MYASFTKLGTPLSPRLVRSEDPDDPEDADDPGVLAHPANDSDKTIAAPKTKDFFIFHSLPDEPAILNSGINRFLPCIASYGDLPP
jgi:hypothetical protein